MRVVVMRHRPLRVYGPEYALGKKAYRLHPETLLSDLRELIVLALYAASDVLARYRHSDSDVSSYLERGFIERAEKRYCPIFCRDCDDDRYIGWLPIRNRNRCPECRERWKAEPGRPQTLFEENLLVFRTFAGSQGWRIVVERQVRAGHQFVIWGGRRNAYLTIYRNCNYNVQPQNSPLAQEIRAWCQAPTGFG